MLNLNEPSVEKLSVEKVRSEFIKSVLDWFELKGRKDLPWQHNPTPYRVWISEVMLQQTQVSTVIPYYLNFMEQFPTLEKLAKAEDDQVLALWSGLGYYSRARNIHKTSKIVKASYSSVFPNTVTELQELPGIGPSTAGAIISLASDKKATILDGNVKRVLARCFSVSGWPGKSEVSKKLWHIAETLTPDSQLRNYTQAMMDIGATLCTRSKPQCEVCPVIGICSAKKEGLQTDYPGKKKKNVLPIKEHYFFLLFKDKQQPKDDLVILFEKRPPSGIWGGLWTPISCDTSEDTEEYLSKNFGMKLKNEQRLNGFRHTFSHFHLEIHPISGQISETPKISESNLRWDSIDNWLEAGIPAPVRKLLESLNKTSN